MKLCPNCKAQLDDNARLCIFCMTSLDEKEHIPQPVIRSRRWPLVSLCCLLLCTCLALLIFAKKPASKEATVPSAQNTPEDTSIRTHTENGVRYTFRPATRQDHPTAIVLDNHYVLIRVEGTPSDGIYRIPSFVGNDTNALVTVVADNAFAGTNVQAIDLGFNVRYVWGNAFGGYPMTDLYLHSDVLIERSAFSGCDENLTVHCPEYLENTKGTLWSELAVQYGFRWQPEAI